MPRSVAETELERKPPTPFLSHPTTLTGRHAGAAWVALGSPPANNTCSWYASRLLVTWSRIGRPPEVPVLREPKSVKILGAIGLRHARFYYQQDTVFNASPYLGFLYQLACHYRRRRAILIQDNASYHKDAEVWSWFKPNRPWLEVPQLPPYSPEFNPTERLWQYTRKNGTHNRYFASQAELVATLARVFGDMQPYPDLIRPSLLPFC